MECIALKVDESQKHFVADNAQSLVEAAFEDGLYTLAIYHNRIMVGFILYDYDEDIPGWCVWDFGYVFIGCKVSKALISSKTAHVDAMRFKIVIVAVMYNERQLRQ